MPDASPFRGPDKVAGHFKSIFDRLETQRRPIEALWRDISMLVDTTRSTEDISPGGRRDRSISTYDNTAVVASARLAALMFGNLTNPAIEWFVLQQLGGELTRDGAQWLQDAQQLLLSIFRSPSSGFNSAISEAFADLSSFGTCCMFVDGEDTIHFNTLYLDELYFATDHLARITTVYRKKCLTAYQAEKLFGFDNLTESVQKAFNSTRKYTETREYLQVVAPKRDLEMDPELQMKLADFPFASIHIDRQEGKRVKVGGFKSFPYAPARWKVASASTYGTSPGMEVIDEIRLANAIKKAVIVAASKAADPPLQADDDTVIGSLRTLPGGITYVRPGSEIRAVPTGDPNVSDVQLADVREFIREAYFNDLDRLPDNDRMTATEVIQRRQDRLQALSPYVTRVQEELLGPLIERTLKLAVEKGDIEQPPREIRGGNIKIEYISPLAISQRSSRTQAFQIWVNAMLPLFQFDASMVNAINTENVPAFLADALNVPLELVRNPEELAERREQSAQLAQLQAEAQVGGELATTAKTAAEAGEIAGRISAA